VIIMHRKLEKEKKIRKLSAEWQEIMLCL